MYVQIHIGTFTRSLLIQIARVTGSLQRAGLEVKESLVASSPAQFKSLEAGEFDLVMTSPDNALAYRFLSQNPLGRNLPVEILAAIDRGLGLSLCLAPDLESVESVRGKIVGVDVPQSGFAFVAYALLEEAGLPPGDYQVEGLGSTPRRADALIAGSCAATVLNAGNELRAAGAGCTTVSRVTNLGAYLGTVLAAMTTRNPADESTRLRFADVLLETSREIQGGRWESEVIDESMNLLGLSEHEAQAHRAILLDPHHGLVSDGIVDRASISTLIELRRKYLPSAKLDSILDSLSTLVIKRALAEPTGPINA
jgi:hypothetical protein